MRSYKSPPDAERAFRCLKRINLLVRPIRRRDEHRVDTHIFWCLLAYYLEWHMRKAWTPMSFEDGELAEERKRRDSILPTKPSESAEQKNGTRKTADGFAAHSLETLMRQLASRVRVTYLVRSDSVKSDVQATT